MLIIDKTLLFKSVYQGFGHQEFVNISALQRAIRLAYEKHAAEGPLIVNDSFAFHPPSKATIATPFNAAIFKYINSFIKQRRAEGVLVLLEHRQKRLIDLVRLAPQITRVITSDPRLLALWIRNPLINFDANFGRKFKLSTSWYYLARKNNFSETDKTALKTLIEFVVAITPSRTNAAIKGLGQKAFNDLMVNPLARETMALSRDFQTRLRAARALLAADLTKPPKLARAT